MLSGNESESDAAPEDLTDKQISFVPPVIADFAPIGSKFGSVKEDAEEKYVTGDVVSVSFHGANPRNDQKIQGSFLTVDVKSGDDWVTKYVDGDWCTKFMWEGGVGHVGQSTATVEWDMKEAEEVEAGTYRVCYAGTRKHVTEKFEDFSGCSREFEVAA